jgi:hypothetical protein
MSLCDPRIFLHDFLVFFYARGSLVRVRVFYVILILFFV